MGSAESSPWEWEGTSLDFTADFLGGVSRGGWITATSMVLGLAGAALATVVGVLVEVPVMLSVCNVCNRTRVWYGGAGANR